LRKASISLIAKANLQARSEHFQILRLDESFHSELGFCDEWKRAFTPGV
jgi:hypothetical protein